MNGELPPSHPEIQSRPELMNISVSPEEREAIIAGGMQAVVEIDFPDGIRPMEKALRAQILTTLHNRPAVVYFLGSEMKCLFGVLDNSPQTDELVQWYADSLSEFVNGVVTGHQYKLVDYSLYPGPILNN